VNRVEGVQLIADSTGYLQDFFWVYASADTRANVLSFNDVEYLDKVMYEKGKGFTIYLPDRDLVFYKERSCTSSRLLRHSPGQTVILG
jgi:hypothetical protein